MPVNLHSSFGRRGSLGMILLTLTLAGVGVASAQTVKRRPCDLFASKTPCVAAFSTTRALYKSYSGPLYQVTRLSDNEYTDIGLLPDGYARVEAHDAFCANTSCNITKLYDQSSNHNDLTPAPPGAASRGPGPEGYDIPAQAEALPTAIDGHKVYGVAITRGTGYRNNTARETAVNGEPEGVYMVTSALTLNTACCFDFGNAETNNRDNNVGHMDAINIRCPGTPCAPLAGLDMEDGIYGNLKVPTNTTFVTDMGANDGQHNYAIYQGDSQTGSLTSTGVILLPDGYQPMRQEGGIILGIGGDNSNGARGYFFEGVMTSGMPDAIAMEAIQKNIVKAHYSSLAPPVGDPTATALR